MPRGPPSLEALFDQRLFNQTCGLDSKYGNEDEVYNVYDKQWQVVGAAAQAIYQPSNSIDRHVYGDDVKKLAKSSKFVLDEEFTGTSYSCVRDEPIQFEKAAEKDPFGPSQFLKEAKTVKQFLDSARSLEGSCPKKTKHWQQNQHRSSAMFSFVHHLPI